MMILQGHRSNSLSSNEEPKISESQQANRFPRRNLKPWARDPPYNTHREANLTPFNTMHMPRLDSPGSQERRSHIPIWEPLYMEDTPDSKEQGGKRQSGMSMDTNSLKVELKSPFSAGADGDDGIDHGCCAWKLCLTFMTANWMSRAM
ncbi:hypothetical protein OCU04_000546 [Sclerotinia nivalis]|uniref:Uncharacterized protein n=1 Tax=Sclerotinia nivalis TaxID=352851 RepID=A0A9X0AZP0_9HELO|nr:hypothetical protein OCU04_000546 [Sclerotinia nivalis]